MLVAYTPREGGADETFENCSKVALNRTALGTDAQTAPQAKQVRPHLCDVHRSWANVARPWLTVAHIGPHVAEIGSKCEFGRPPTTEGDLKPPRTSHTHTHTQEGGDSYVARACQRR